MIGLSESSAVFIRDNDRHSIGIMLKQNWYEIADDRWNQYPAFVRGVAPAYAQLRLSSGGQAVVLTFCSFRISIFVGA